jgi:hypothetical protein
VVNGKAPGSAPLLIEAHGQALLQIVENGPIPAVHGVVRCDGAASDRNLSLGSPGSACKTNFGQLCCSVSVMEERAHAARQSLEFSRDAANMATRYLDHREILSEMPQRIPAVLRRKIHHWHCERCGNIPSESLGIHFFEAAAFGNRN